MNSVCKLSKTSEISSHLTNIKSNCKKEKYFGEIGTMLFCLVITRLENADAC